MAITITRYVHRWRFPIIVVVEETAENWYHAPHYDPRKLPVVKPAK